MLPRIAVFIGTRPEAIKMAPVIAQLRQSGSFDTQVVNAGQHREMIQQVIDRFGIQVDVLLDAMLPNQSLAQLTSRLIERIDRTLESLQPHAVLVQGDTTTVCCAALASFYRRIPVGHVEAGLRTGNLYSPFPEEANRRITSPLVKWHFAPTPQARKALIAEGISEGSVHVTGNTVIDALLMEVERQQQAPVKRQIHSRLAAHLGENWHQRGLILVTGHRRENFGDGFEQICRALSEISRRFPEQLIVYPVHLNPRVREVVFERLSGAENILLIEPQPYAEFVALIAACRVILTDSGGVQEEAPSLGKPVLVMRDTTERPEGVSAGNAKLVGTDAELIIEETTRLLTDSTAYGKMAEVANPYGDGRASQRIVDVLERHFA